MLMKSPGAVLSLCRLLPCLLPNVCVQDDFPAYGQLGLDGIEMKVNCSSLSSLVVQKHTSIDIVKTILQVFVKPRCFLVCFPSLLTAEEPISV